MKRTLLFAAVLSAGSLFSSIHAEAASFTYHGNLQDAGKPAQGSYDIELTLYTAPTGGSIIGGPLTVYAVEVHDGTFSTEADFGPLAKSFSQSYVGVRVRAAGQGDYAALDTRTNAVIDTNTSCPGSWSLDGNAGNPAGSYLGTADSASLLLKTNAVQIAKADMSGGGTVPRWIGGGAANTSSNGQGAFVGGGGSVSDTTKRNAVGPFSVVAGGDSNEAGVGAASGYAAICGGTGNKADANYATIGGGQSNTASGSDSTIPGGILNTATGAESFAAGTAAEAVNDGAFVWADTTGFSSGGFSSTGTNQFDVLATGGVGINTANGPLGTDPLGGTELTIRSSSGLGHQTWINLLSQRTATSAFRGINFASDPVPGDSIDDGILAIRGIYKKSDGTLLYEPMVSAQTFDTVSATDGNTHFQLNGAPLNILNTITVGTTNSNANGHGASLTIGGVWTNASSRTFKDGFMQVDAMNVLDKVVSMPVQTWFYKGDHAEGRHMGPIAEDFAQAFGLGFDEKHIGTVDESGVAFAAIKGLNEKVETENAQLKTQNVALQGKLDEVLARLAKLETAKGN